MGGGGEEKEGRHRFKKAVEVDYRIKNIEIERDIDTDDYWLSKLYSIMIKEIRICCDWIGMMVNRAMEELCRVHKSAAPPPSSSGIRAQLLVSPCACAGGAAAVVVAAAF